MNRKTLEDMGLSKENIDQILNQVGQELQKEKDKTTQALQDVQSLTEQLTQRNADIQKLTEKETDAEGIKSQLEALQQKYTTDTDNYKKLLSDRDYTDAIRTAVAEKGIKFSSKSAEKLFFTEINNNRLQMKDGKLIGFDDYYKIQMQNDPEAFAKAEAEKAPTFSNPSGLGNPVVPESKGVYYAKQFNNEFTKK